MSPRSLIRLTLDQKVDSCTTAGLDSYGIKNYGKQIKLLYGAGTGTVDLEFINCTVYNGIHRSILYPVHVHTHYSMIVC